MYQRSYLLLQQYSSLQLNYISFYQLLYSPCVDDPLVSYKTICSVQLNTSDNSHLNNCLPLVNIKWIW